MNYLSAVTKLSLNRYTIYVLCCNNSYNNCFKKQDKLTVFSLQILLTICWSVTGDVHVLQAIFVTVLSLSLSFELPQ